MSELAINGGEPIRKVPFPDQLTIGEEEKKAVQEVMNSGSLSAFRGNWMHTIPGFWGGEQIQGLEKEWNKYFNVQHSISVNSCTSALQIACGAVGIQPGDEVIVTPWSMSCSATAPMVWQGTPVFADIEKEYFCLDPKSVEEKITERTKAIIYVDLFGSCGRISEIMDIAKKHNLYVIEDAAQAIGSKSNNKYAGTIGHIGCYSFTQGKHLTCGEGGMIGTDDIELAMRCQLIRNHAESAIHGMGKEDITNYSDTIKYNMLGFNMRMTEIQAAIIREQLKKLRAYTQLRVDNVYFINDALIDIDPITVCDPEFNCTHSYYTQPLLWDANKADGLHRNKFIEAVKAELKGEKNRPDKPMLNCGYITPLYRFPLFQNKVMYKSTISPFFEHIDYIPSNYPNVESLWENELFLSLYQNLPLSGYDLKDITDAFWKVWENRKGIM
jgi:perosamine synthetase